MAQTYVFVKVQSDERGQRIGRLEVQLTAAQIAEIGDIDHGYLTLDEIVVAGILALKRTVLERMPPEEKEKRIEAIAQVAAAKIEASYDKEYAARADEAQGEALKHAIAAQAHHAAETIGTKPDAGWYSGLDTLPGSGAA